MISLAEEAALMMFGPPPPPPLCKHPEEYWIQLTPWELCRHQWGTVATDWIHQAEFKCELCGHWWIRRRSRPCPSPGSPPWWAARVLAKLRQRANQ